MAMSVPGPGFAGIHGELVAERAQEDAALGEVVHQVEVLAHVTAQSAQDSQL
jgi:hypothetical protein